MKLREVGSPPRTMTRFRLWLLERNTWETWERMKRVWRRFSVAVLTVVCTVASSFAQTSEDALRKGFENPPSSARPRVWWHWMNGNISQDGIKLDLEWMHRSGIAGFQNFDAALQTPQVVPKRLVYMTPEWKQAFLYATKLADQFGMEEAIAGSPGWSESGGPWVPGPHGMKKYVWSETVVEGGQPFQGKLPHPPGTTGAFQNMPIHEQFGEGGKGLPEFYADAVVIAYKKPASDVAIDPKSAKITASGSDFDSAMLSDGDLVKPTHVPIPAEGSSSWIQYEFPSPQTIRAISYVTPGAGFVEQLMSRTG